MPVFDYRCPKCENIFEFYVQKYDEILPCPLCKHVPLEKKFSSFAVRGFPRIPRNHLPKKMGGDIAPKGNYWQNWATRGINAS